jgi:hypothetical protein
MSLNLRVTMDAFRSFVYELYIMVKFIYLSAKQLFQEACRTVKPLNGKQRNYFPYS